MMMKDDEKLYHAFLLYRQMAPIPVVMKVLHNLQTWPTIEAQEAIHCHLLSHPLDDKFPLVLEYRARFLRRLNADLEESGEEVVDPILRDLNEILCRPKNIGDNTSTSYVTFFIPVSAVGGSSNASNDTSPIVIQPLCVRVAPKENNVGLRLWEAGFVLAEYLLQHPDLTKGRHLIELGAGVGLVGLIAAYCLEAKEVTVTDSEVEVLHFLRHNIEANATLCSNEVVSSPQQSSSAQEGRSDFFPLSKNIKTAVLDWSQPSDYEALRGDIGPVEEEEEEEEQQQCENTCSRRRRRRKEIVAAADCVYDRQVIPYLVDVLVYALRPREENPCDDAAGATEEEEEKVEEEQEETIVLIASTLRDESTYQFFHSCLEARGLIVEEIAGKAKAAVIDGCGIDGVSRSSPFYSPNRGAVKLVRIRLGDGIEARASTESVGR